MVSFIPGQLVDSEERLPFESAHIQAVLFDCDGVLVDTEPLGRALLLEHLRSCFGDSYSTLENDLCWIWPLGAPLGPSLARAHALLKERHPGPEAFVSQASWPMDLEHSIRREMGQHLQPFVCDCRNDRAFCAPSPGKDLLHRGLFQRTHHKNETKLANGGLPRTELVTCL
jgi:hypothetical protein